ncbi:unnamed protein product, partial [marine sediment metagenome]
GLSKVNFPILLPFKKISTIWSFIDELGTWANQKESLLFLNFEDQTNYNLDITMMPLYTPEIDQIVEIFLNGNNIGKFTL